MNANTVAGIGTAGTLNREALRGIGRGDPPRGGAGRPDTLG